MPLPAWTLVIPDTRYFTEARKGLLMVTGETMGSFQLLSEYLQYICRRKAQETREALEAQTVHHNVDRTGLFHLPVD